MKRNVLKKKALHVAVATALAGGMVQTASAVHWNPDGTGEVLIYPYWTVNATPGGSYDTLVSIVNTTDRVKAVKVRFLEYKNSWEVLDFNLYLSPFDVWVAAVGDFDNDGIAEIRTPDTSCTAPQMVGDVEFRPFAIQVEEGNAAATNDRLREGHIEAIEMGELVDDGPGNTPATWATHGAGQDCAALEDWANDPTRWSSTVLPPAGGLFGGASLINVQEGTDYAYNAIALDAWSNTPQHHEPGSTLPSLNDGDPISHVFADANGDGTPEVVESLWFTGGGIDAVSAVFLHQAIMNEYALDPAILGDTDWVVTFPTKRFYVNQNPPRAPFTSVYDPNNGACEDVALRLWDREEQTVTPPRGFSPPPPVQRDALCWETNVITFDVQGGAIGDVLGSASTLHVATPFEDGWMRLTFSNPDQQVTSDDGVVYHGLPAVGFQVQRFTNGNVGGLLSNYGGLFDHRYSRNIISS